MKGGKGDKGLFFTCCLILCERGLGKNVSATERKENRERKATRAEQNLVA